MESRLQVLRAARVTEVAEIHDYVQLRFSNGYGLSIYNDFVIKPEGRSLRDLESKRVGQIKEPEEQIILRFEDGSSLCVCLKDEAWHGPEAMQLNTPAGQTIVWN